MMLHLIARRHGPALAQVIANGFVAQRMRCEAEPQRPAIEQITGDSRAPLTRVLHDMEENLAVPLSARELARRAGISVRALGRVINVRVGQSPMRYYRKVRLQAARNASFYSDIHSRIVRRRIGIEWLTLDDADRRQHAEPIGVGEGAFVVEEQFQLRWRR
jgi:AraC-like DNA-binding protein